MVQLAPELQVAPDAQYQNNQGAGQGGPAQPLQGFEIPQLQKCNAGQYQIQGGADVGEKGAFIGQAGSFQGQVVAQNDVFFQLVVHGGKCLMFVLQVIKKPACWRAFGSFVGCSRDSTSSFSAQPVPPRFRLA